MSENDGGPAFPGCVYSLNNEGIEQIGEHTFRVPGMSLRDWFAGMVLQGLIADNCILSEAPHIAYEIADAMLKQRKETP